MGLNLVLLIYFREWSGVPGRVKAPVFLWGDLPNLVKEQGKSIFLIINDN